MMDRKSAWNIFTASGKVEDYIRFKQVSREETFSGIGAENTGARSEAYDGKNVTSQSYDYKDSRTYTVKKEGEQAWLNRLP